MFVVLTKLVSNLRDFEAKREGIGPKTTDFWEMRLTILFGVEISLETASRGIVVEDSR